MELRQGSACREKHTFISWVSRQAVSVAKLVPMMKPMSVGSIQSTDEACEANGAVHRRAAASHRGDPVAWYRSQSWPGKNPLVHPWLPLEGLVVVHVPLSPPETGYPDDGEPKDVRVLAT